MYEQQEKLVDNVVEQMWICADMIGVEDENKRGQYGFVPGLNENQLAESLKTRIETIEKGIFQVMFTGCFNAGKSTLINALLKSKVLKTSSKPETAVITKIFFNAEEEKVIIYKRDKFDENGQTSTEEMYDLDEFFKEYTIDEKDREKFLRSVNHVEIFLQKNGIAGSMVQFVDSPGTQASTADDEVSLKFVEHADAVIFLISAIAAMDQYDKEYIAKRFANRHMKNVFFVINRVNQLNDIQDFEAVKTRVRDELTEVFLDEYGNFDQALYDKRVFFVNAFGSFNTRIGQETPMGPFGSMMIPDEKTGIPQFETVLGEFLTSGDKDKIALSAYRPQMASIFVAAEKAVKNRSESIKNGVEKNKHILTAYENDKQEIEDEINAIKRAIDETELNILRDIKDSYDQFLREVEEKWDAYFAEHKEEMQISYSSLILAQANLSLAFWKDKSLRERQFNEKTLAATKPFADGIQAFLQECFNDLSRDFSFRLQNNIAKLMKDLNNHQKRLEKLSIPISIEEIIEKIALEKNIPIKGIGDNKANLGQAFLAIFFADPELLVAAGSGNRGTMDFIVDIIKTNIIDIVITTVLIAIIGNIFAIIAFVMWKIFKARNKKQSLTDQLIAETKLTILNGYKNPDGTIVENEGTPVFTGLRGEYKATYINKTSSVVNAVINRSGTELIKGIESNLAEVEENLQKTNELISSGEIALNNEISRMNKILDTIAESISQISLLTADTELTKEEIRNLAVISK